MVENVNFASGAQALPRPPAPPPVQLRPTDPASGTQPLPKPEAAEPEQRQDASEPVKTDPETLRKQTESLTKLMQGLGNRLEFGVFQDTDRLFAKIVDRESGRIVKMLPPEGFLQLKQKIKEAVGGILDEEI